MPTDLREEVLDTCLSAAERFPKDYEKCTQARLFLSVMDRDITNDPHAYIAPIVKNFALICCVNTYICICKACHILVGLQTIKESLDKKTGGPWHVVAGLNFSYDISHKVGYAHHYRCKFISIVELFF